MDHPSFAANNLEQLAQLRPADTNAAALVTPNDKEKIIVTLIVITNVDSANHDFRIFHDDDGTTYDQGTALYYDEALAANTTKILNFAGSKTDPGLGGLPILDGGNLAVRSDGADDLTFTAYGFRIPRRHGA